MTRRKVARVATSKPANGSPICHVQLKPEKPIPLPVRKAAF